VRWSDLPSWLLKKEHTSSGAVEFVAFVALSCLPEDPDHEDSVVCWVTDAEAADAAWANQRSPSPLCNALIKIAQRRFRKRRTLVYSRHVKRELNVLADTLSHCDHATYWGQRPQSDRQIFAPVADTLRAELSTLTPIFG
jgi:hypothetical protein